MVVILHLTSLNGLLVIGVAESDSGSDSTSKRAQILRCTRKGMRGSQNPQTRFNVRLIKEIMDMKY